jgi:hypothetical protein
LREFRIERYGEEIGKGKHLLQWVTEHYERAGAIGGDPLSYRQPGAALFKKKAAASPTQRQRALSPRR